MAKQQQSEFFPSLHSKYFNKENSIYETLPSFAHTQTDSLLEHDTHNQSLTQPNTRAIHFSPNLGISQAQSLTRGTANFVTLLSVFTEILAVAVALMVIVVAFKTRSGVVTYIPALSFFY